MILHEKDLKYEKYRRRVFDRSILDSCNCLHCTPKSLSRATHHLVLCCLHLLEPTATKVEQRAYKIL